MLAEDVLSARVVGRAAHQGPEDGGTVVLGHPAGVMRGARCQAVVVEARGADLIAQAIR